MADLTLLVIRIQNNYNKLCHFVPLHNFLGHCPCQDSTVYRYLDDVPLEWSCRDFEVLVLDTRLVHFDIVGIVG